MENESLINSSGEAKCEPPKPCSQSSVCRSPQRILVLSLSSHRCSFFTPPTECPDIMQQTRGVHTALCQKIIGLESMSITKLGVVCSVLIVTRTFNMYQSKVIELKIHRIKKKTKQNPIWKCAQKDIVARKLDSRAYCTYI